MNLKCALSVLILLFNMTCFSQTIPAKVYKISSAALKTVLSKYDSIEVNVIKVSGMLQVTIKGYDSNLEITGSEPIAEFLDNGTTLPIRRNVIAPQPLRCYANKGVDFADWDFKPDPGIPFYYLLPVKVRDVRNGKLYLYYHITMSPAVSNPYCMSVNPIPPASPGHSLL